MLNSRLRMLGLRQWRPSLPELACCANHHWNVCSSSYAPLTTTYNASQRWWIISRVEALSWDQWMESASINSHPWKSSFLSLNHSFEKTDSDIGKLTGTTLCLSASPQPHSLVKSTPFVFLHWACTASPVPQLHIANLVPFDFSNLVCSSNGQFITTEYVVWCVITGQSIL